MDDVITLIKEIPGRDAIGNICPTVTERENIFCRVQSISQQEFFKAGQNGLRAAYKFIVFKGDYEGEKLVRYKDTRYAVYRTFEPDTDEVELYAREEEGVTDV